MSSAAVSPSAVRLLLPMISPSDVHLLIEHELTKNNTATSASAMTSGVASFLSRGCPVDDKVSLMSTVNPATVEPSTSSTFVGSKCHESVSPVSGSDGWHLDSAVKKAQTDNSEAAYSVRQSSTDGERPLCCKLDIVTDVKKSNVDFLASECDSVLHTRQTSSGLPADGRTELPFESATAPAGLCENRLSSSEINNNCRRSNSSSSIHSDKVGSNVVVGHDAAVRKSKRCNRGRRYHELMSQGVLHHHTSRKRSESLTL